ncbi:hypothetical protein QTP88_024400, partial [Uroleucon formosanum]
MNARVAVACAKRYIIIQNIYNTWRRLWWRRHTTTQLPAAESSVGRSAQVRVPHSDEGEGGVCVRPVDDALTDYARPSPSASAPSVYRGTAPVSCSRVRSY